MNEDFLDLLSALNDAEVRFLVVGAYAVGVHGRPRATKDLDVWVEASAENARRVIAALRKFGAPLGDLTEADFETPGTGFKMGVPPCTPVVFVPEGECGQPVPQYGIVELSPQ